MEKHNKSCLEKYGSVNNTKKQQQTCLNKYGVNTALKVDFIKEKIRKTCIQKYGNTNHIEKQQETCFKKYGVISSLCLNSCREKRKSEESLQKEYATKRKNNSFNKSKPEDESYILLKEKYSDIIRQYRSKLYPFNCDFYIPSIDLYIECNYHWTHEFHPFDPNNEEDIKRYNKLQELYHGKYGKTWVDLDVRKRNIAKQNNLNWLEFFSIQELKDWLEKQ